MTTIHLGPMNSGSIDTTFGRKEMLRRAVSGMRHAAPRIRATVAAHVQGALKGNKAARSIQTKVWNQKANRFPALQVFSKIPWLNVHQQGRVIRGRMLIQLGRVKGSRKAFKALVDRLMAAGLAFFRKGRDGRVYLFAKPPKGSRGLAGARKIERAARLVAGQRGTIKKGEAYPIAILVTTVNVRKRLNLDRAIKSGIPGMVRAMELA